VAGVLTTLAPCVLSLLPVIVGGSVATGATRPRRRAVIVTASLGASVVLFSVLLKASTVLIDIPPSAWSWVSGGLLILLGLSAAFPGAWTRIADALRLQNRSGAGLNSALDREGPWGAVLTGAALGPVFSSCSPMYGYIVVTALPAAPVYGLALLLAYTLGLCGVLFAIAMLGHRLIRRLGWAADSHGVFRRALGWVFVAVGIMVLTGADRWLQAWLIENSPVAPWLLDSLFVPAPE
jgi:cytochrome c biogenesis protein CcdA